MPKREIGIRGYVGELIVEQWLRSKFPSNQGYEIVNQIRPKGVAAKGGPYLDFGVIHRGIVHEIYEVKTQDYNLNKINEALKHVWGNPIGPYLIQDKKAELMGTGGTRARLVLLVKPQKSLTEEIAVDNIVYFKTILNDSENMQEGVDLKRIKDCFDEDVQKTINKIIN
jgi:hypothetical protein